LLQDLVEKGMPRDDAYKAVQENAMAAWESDTSFQERVSKDARIAKYLDAGALGAHLLICSGNSALSMPSSRGCLAGIPRGRKSGASSADRTSLI